MKLYNLLSGGLKPIDYILIAGLIAVAVALTAIVVWQKVKGKGGCGCDCGSCNACPSAKQGGCNGSCNACPSQKEDKNA